MSTVGRLEKAEEPKLLPPQPLWWKIMLAIVIFGPFIVAGYVIVSAFVQHLFPVGYIVGLFVGVSLTVFGIGAGFHRMLMHRGFKLHPLLEFFVLVFGSMAGEGSALAWCGDHGWHHAHADKADDLHSPHTSKIKGIWGILAGLLHAHVGWLFLGKHANPRIYARHLYRDPIAVAVSDTFVVWFVLGFLIPFLIGGWQGFLWMGIVRLLITHQVTFMVNSVCHVWGQRPFDTDDYSTNNAFVEKVTFGEGDHNNHHACPRSARHGFLPGQLDVTWMIIWSFFKLRLADDLYHAECEVLPETKQIKLDEKDQPIYVLRNSKLRDVYGKVPLWVIESEKRGEKAA